jgi:hypothetical protein
MANDFATTPFCEKNRRVRLEAMNAFSSAMS